MDYVEKRVETVGQFEGFSFTHDTTDISEGPIDTMYTNPILKGMADKIKAELGPGKDHQQSPDAGYDRFCGRFRSRRSGVRSVR